MRGIRISVCRDAKRSRNASRRVRLARGKRANDADDACVAKFGYTCIDRGIGNGLRHQFDWASGVGNRFLVLGHLCLPYQYRGARVDRHAKQPNSVRDKVIQLHRGCEV